MARRSPKARFAIRLLGSTVLASIVVLAMLTVGLKCWGVFDVPERGLKLQSLRLLSDFDRIRLAGLLGDDQRAAPPTPAIGEIPRVPRRDSEVSGFVQLEVTVAPDGRVQGVEVLGAAPAGLYEAQARQIMLERRYAPSTTGETRTTTEIVDFKVPRD